MFPRRKTAWVVTLAATSVLGGGIVAPAMSGTTVVISCVRGIVAPAMSLIVVAPSQDVSSRERCAQGIDSSRQTLASAPNDVDARLTLARILASCQQYTEAITQYQQVVQARPRDASIFVELGDALRRAQRNQEAAAAYQKALDLKPGDASATFGLAQALAASADYAGALERYDEILKARPDDYDALEGKAFVLFWTRRFAEARSLFERLHDQNPKDEEAATALRGIADAEREAAEAQSRPAPSASLQEFLAYYERLLQSDPEQTDALEGLASTKAQMKDFKGAIEDYRKALVIDSHDLEAELGLARVLGWDHQYGESIRVYQKILATTPDDADVLEGLARVDAESGRAPDAIHIYQKLLSRDPGNVAYQLQIARLALAAKDYPVARDSLASVLARHPQDRDVRFQLAQLETKQGQYRDALNQYNELLRQNPTDGEALFGKAQVSYYRGDIPAAYETASRLVAEQPNNYDALFLLASVQHARGKRRGALELLQRADRLSPNNPEVVALREKLEDESAITLHASASYAREISQPGSGNPVGFEREDLRTSAFGTTVGMSFLPKSDSSFMVSYLPSNIPRGGIAGAVAPSEFLYQQTTPLEPLITLRGGLGVARFGPGLAVNFPSGAGPQPGATVSPIGYFGGTLAPERPWSLDLTWSRAALPYTPLAVRLGVIESRTEAGVNYRPNPRTEFHLTYYKVRDSSESYAHLSTAVNPTTGQRIIINGADDIKGSGGTFVFNRNLVRASRLSLDTGYSGQVYGYDGPRRGVFLGFFSPSYYQQHLLTTKLKTKLWGPLGYEFSGGVGIQQVDQRQALTRAVIVSPAFTLKVSRRVSLKLGYTYYDVAQAIGVVRGNAVELTTDWKF